MTLLTETINVLDRYGRTPKDVLFVANRKHYVSWDTFAALANFAYDDDYGSAVIADDLVIVGHDFWLERHEYDGSEWWAFQQKPQKPALEAASIDFNLRNTF